MNAIDSKHFNHFLHYGRQRGYATLAIGLIILVSLTFVTFYAAKVGMLEQRTSANKVRADAAFVWAEAGIENAIAYLGANRGSLAEWPWASCSGVTAPPCGDGSVNLYGADWLYLQNVHTTRAGFPAPPARNTGVSTYAAHYLTPSISGAPAAKPVVTVVAQGFSDDDTGRALVKQSINFYPLLGGTAAAPLMAGGTVGGSGTFDIVTNPNGGGPGVPLSTWSKQGATFAGTSGSCQPEEFLASRDPSFHTVESFTDENGVLRSITKCPRCTCPADKRLTSGSDGIDGIDILDVDGNLGAHADAVDFPTNVFEYVFGPGATAALIKGGLPPDRILPNCDTLNSGSSGMWWIEGSCEPNVNIGSYQFPVLLVIEGGFRVNGNLEIFALLFGYNEAGTPFNVSLLGGPTLYGAVISDQNVDFGSGNYKMRFDSSVLARLSSIIGGSGLGRVPGSWADY